MAKDKDDPGTIDVVPKKRGRPALSEFGPMSASERKARSRQNSSLVPLPEVPTSIRDRVQKISERLGIEPRQYLIDLIAAQKLPRK